MEDVFFLPGIISGVVHTVFGYPLDTLKARIQNQSKIKGGLWKGIRFPVSQAMITNTFIFQNYEFFHQQFPNPYASNFVTAVTTSIFICPFEKFKVMNQSRIPYSIHVKSILLSFKDLNIVCARKIPGTFLYFSTFDYMKKKEYSTLFSGSMAGMISWTFTYPIDTIKTRIQSGTCKTWKEAIQKGSLNKGIGYCMIRSFFVNGINFHVYEHVKNICNK